MVTAALREQLQRVTDADGVLVLLEISHPGMATARIVNDTRSWTVLGNTYVGLPFVFQLPQAVGSQAPRAQLVIDNAGLDLVQDLEALPTGAWLTATVRLVSRADLTEIEWEWVAPLSGVRVTQGNVSAVLGNDHLLRGPAVQMRYDQVTSPGLFAG